MAVQGTLLTSEQVEAERQQTDLDRPLGMPMSAVGFQSKAGTATTDPVPTNWSCIEVAPERLIPTSALSQIEL